MIAVDMIYPVTLQPTQHCLNMFDTKDREIDRNLATVAHDRRGCDTLDNSQTDSDRCTYVDVSGDEVESDLDLDTTLIMSFTQLMKKYRSVTNESRTDNLVMSGGLQQFLNRKACHQKSRVTQPRKGDGSEITTFHDLPVSSLMILFYIYLYLYLFIR